MSNRDPHNWFERLHSSVVMLLLGIGILAFLVAIDRPHWFNLRPASGTAAAMSHAAAPAIFANAPDRGGALR